MRKKLLLILILIGTMYGLYSENRKVNHLEDFFGTKDYQTDVYMFGNNRIYYSYINVDNSVYIISKGIFYSYENNEINKLPIRDNEKIFYNNDMHEYIAPQKFYGWRVNVFAKEEYISTDFYSNLGKNVTDGPNFDWDSEKKEFYLLEVDRSQW